MLPERKLDYSGHIKEPLICVNIYSPFIIVFVWSAFPLKGVFSCLKSNRIGNQPLFSPCCYIRCSKPWLTCCSHDYKSLIKTRCEFLSPKTLFLKVATRQCCLSSIGPGRGSGTGWKGVWNRLEGGRGKTRWADGIEGVRRSPKGKGGR